MKKLGASNKSKGLVKKKQSEAGQTVQPTDFPLWIQEIEDPIIKKQRQDTWYRAFIVTGMALKPQKQATEALVHKRTVTFLKYQYGNVRFISNLAGENFGKGQAMNVRSLQWGNGAPDLMIFAPSGDGKYCGLAIELKADNAQPYKKDGSLKAGDHLREQQDYLNYLIEVGWKAVFAAGDKNSIDVITKYFENGKPTKNAVQEINQTELRFRN